MASKGKERAVEPFTLTMKDREKNPLCSKCRKRDSCFIQPIRIDYCYGLEIGIPYVDPGEVWRNEKSDKVSITE